MKRRYLAALTLLVTAAAWGATFTLVKNILRTIAPEPFIFYRFTLAGLILLIVAAARGRLTRDLLRPGIILGLLVFAGYWMQTRGLLFISPSRSAFLTGLYVVVVPFCDALVYRVRVSLRAWAGSVLALIGTAAMIGGFDARPGLGDALTVACAAVFAFHVILSARFSAQHSATGLAAARALGGGLPGTRASLSPAPTKHAPKSHPPFFQRHEQKGGRRPHPPRGGGAPSEGGGARRRVRAGRPPPPPPPAHPPHSPSPSTKPPSPTRVWEVFGGSSRWRRR